MAGIRKKRQKEQNGLLGKNWESKAFWEKKDEKDPEVGIG